MDWQISLEARDLSPATIESYTEAATLLDRFLVDSGITELRDMDRRAIENFIIDQRKKVSPGFGPDPVPLDSGSSQSLSRRLRSIRQRSLSLLLAWAGPAS